MTTVYVLPKIERIVPIVREKERMFDSGLHGVSDLVEQR